MTVAAGSATSQQQGSQLDITVSRGAVLNWSSFNIKPGETTTFHQPDSRSIVWNRILDANPSQIWGNLNANGNVVLFNQNGFYFGPNSVVNVGGLVVTTGPAMPGDFATGGIWQFSGMPPAATIVNYGQLQARDGGSLFLIATHIENQGRIEAPEGNIGLYAGKEVLVSQSPDGRALSARVRLPAGSVDNRGEVVADAGSIAFHAQVVNQGGLVQANSVREHAGVIEFVASDAITLDEHSRTLARGDAGAESPGGRIVVKSEGTFSDAPSSVVSVAGGGRGGSGGQVEVSAYSFTGLQGTLDGHALKGWTGGELLLDPQDIILAGTGTGTAPDGSVPRDGAPAAGTLRLNIHSSFVGFAHISLQATRDISLADNTVFNLADSTGVDEPGSLLTLQAGRNITFGNNAGIQGGQNWSVQLVAGADFRDAGSTVPGGGGIYLNGGPGLSRKGFIETAAGNINLFAGTEVLVAGGYIRTLGGGGIQVRADSGDVNAGTKPDGYDYFPSGYDLSARGLGGISTGAGGDVSIRAGHDILSVGAVSGAYGMQGGDVTLDAGNRVMGSYLVHNGDGRITAGLARNDDGDWTVRNAAGDIGSAASPLTLSLVSGSWEARAARDLYLNEVRNPNGVFNSAKPSAEFNGLPLTFNGRPVTPDDRLSANYFDYAPDAAVTLVGGNSVQLLGSNLTRPANGNPVPIIYPPRLTLDAGAGGILLGNDVTLFPSSKGDLSITTRDGGPFRSVPGSIHRLIVSDSDSPRYGTFADGHGATPLHAGDTDPILIAVAGNLENLFLQLPKRTEITVGGDAYNFSFEGQNLKADDATRITVKGSLGSHLDRSFVTLSDDADLTALDLALTMNPTLASRVTYDPLTRRLGIVNRMTEEDLAFLLAPTVRTFDLEGLPILDNTGNPVTELRPLTRDVAALQALYTDSQSIPTSSLAWRGLQLGGPGRFELEAHNLSLGVSQGIRSVGTVLNPNLASLQLPGASIDVQVAGALDLTSSQIASFSGGGIKIQAGGTIDVGSQEQFTGDDTPKGIFTTSGGAVEVVARGDVNVNGSRIASYNGGNVTVKSLEGDVNAGVGGLGAVVVYRTFVDPDTGVTRIGSSRIPGSGILATTLRGSSAQIGDISVEAARDILASKGGLFQLSFSDQRFPNAQVSLTAGRDILARDSGIVGGNVSLKAGRNTEAVVVARGSLDIQSVQSANVVALAAGAINVSAGGAVSGTLVSTTGINASGAEGISANLVSTSVQSSSKTSGEVGVAQTAAARSDSKSTIDASQTLASNDKSPKDDEDNPATKKVKAPVLRRLVSRVTVLLTQN